MSKKPRHLALGIMLLVCSCTQAQLVAIRLSAKDGHPQYELNRRPVTEATLGYLLQRLQNLSPGQQVLVATSAETPASDLLGLLLTIREIGLTNVVITVPAIRKGQKGRITISADISPRSVSDVGGYVGGFETCSDFDGLDESNASLRTSGTNSDIPVVPVIPKAYK